MFQILPSHAEVRTGLLTLVNSSITPPLSGMFELFEKKVLIGYRYYVGTVLLRFADCTRLLGNGLI